MKTLNFIWIVLLHISVVWTNPVDKAEKRHNVKSSANGPENNVDSTVLLKPNEPQDVSPLVSTCVTRECIGASYRILNQIDMRADPCDDFYKVRNIFQQSILNIYYLKIFLVYMWTFPQ